jgi:hypothetical protein
MKQDQDKRRPTETVPPIPSENSKAILDSEQEGSTIDSRNRMKHVRSFNSNRMFEKQSTWASPNQQRNRGLKMSQSNQKILDSPISKDHKPLLRSKPSPSQGKTPEDNSQRPLMKKPSNFAVLIAKPPRLTRASDIRIQKIILSPHSKFSSKQTVKDSSPACKLQEYQFKFR